MDEFFLGPLIRVRIWVKSPRFIFMLELEFNLELELELEIGSDFFVKYFEYPRAALKLGFNVCMVHFTILQF